LAISRAGETAKASQSRKNTSSVGDFFVVLQLADVRSVEIGLKGQLLLCDPRGYARLSQFLA
jgi:hypothetical protein